MSTNGDSVTPSMLDAAIVAYVGKGRVKIPTADPDAVRAVDPVNAEALLSAVQATLRASDRIEFAEVQPFDDGLRQRLYRRLREILPALSTEAIEALGWRWGYLNLR
jgi:hypothetical protein